MEKRVRFLRKTLFIAGALLVAGSMIRTDGELFAQAQGTRISKKAKGHARDTAGRAKRRSERIRTFASRWRGTPYLWGGETRSGVDCSGYLREMYREIFNIELPRTTRDQIGLGVTVPLGANRLGGNFEPGDLFFYVDSLGVPNHVVTYMGDGQFTHSASGRGVVVEGFKALWGRRIVGRRLLFPAKDGGDELAPIQAAAPFVAVEVPCPPNIAPTASQIRQYRMEEIRHPADLGYEQICEWRALKQALQKRGGPAAAANVNLIDRQIEWLQSLEYLKGELGRP